MLNRSAYVVIGQVIIRGQIVDSDTHLPIARGLVARLLDRAFNPVVPIALADFRLTLKQTANGEFAVFGVPETLPFDKTKVYQWSIELDAQGYQTHTQPFVFGALGAQPELVKFVRPIMGDAFSVWLFRVSLPVRLGTINLQALP